MTSSSFPYNQRTFHGTQSTAHPSTSSGLPSPTKNQPSFASQGILRSTAHGHSLHPHTHSHPHSHHLPQHPPHHLHPSFLGSYGPSSSNPSHHLSPSYCASCDTGKCRGLHDPIYSSGPSMNRLNPSLAGGKCLRLPSTTASSTSPGSRPDMGIGGMGGPSSSLHASAHNSTWVGPQFRGSCPSILDLHGGAKRSLPEPKCRCSQQIHQDQEEMHHHGLQSHHHGCHQAGHQHQCGQYPSSGDRPTISRHKLPSNLQTYAFNSSSSHQQSHHSPSSHTPPITKPSNLKTTGSSVMTGAKSRIPTAVPSTSEMHHFHDRDMHMSRHLQQGPPTQRRQMSPQRRQMSPQRRQSSPPRQTSPQRISSLIPSLQKVVKFNLNPTYSKGPSPLDRYHMHRTKSLEELAAQETGVPVDPDILSRGKRNLPEAPAYKHPTSPTMPMAKMKLLKEMISNSDLNFKRKMQISPIPRYSMEHDFKFGSKSGPYFPYSGSGGHSAMGSSLPGSPVRGLSRSSRDSFLNAYPSSQFGSLHRGMSGDYDSHLPYSSLNRDGTLVRSSHIPSIASLSNPDLTRIPHRYSYQTRDLGSTLQREGRDSNFLGYTPSLASASNLHKLLNDCDDSGIPESRLISTGCQKFPSVSEITRPPFLEPTYDLIDKYEYNYDNFFKSKRDKLKPFFTSAPPSRSTTPTGFPMNHPFLSVSPTMLCKQSGTSMGGGGTSALGGGHIGKEHRGNDPLLPDVSQKVVFKNQLKYFIEERKNQLGLGADYTPQTGSESDIKALLNMYSNPPDPVKSKYPPPGVSSYQSVPQGYVDPNKVSVRFTNSSLPRRHSFGSGCPSFFRPSPSPWPGQPYASYAPPTASSLLQTGTRNSASSSHLHSMADARLARALSPYPPMRNPDLTDDMEQEIAFRSILTSPYSQLGTNMPSTGLKNSVSYYGYK